jgi:hypothetical protein
MKNDPKKELLKALLAGTVSRQEIEAFIKPKSTFTGVEFIYRIGPERFKSDKTGIEYTQEEVNAKPALGANNVYNGIWIIVPEGIEIDSVLA